MCTKKIGLFVVVICAGASTCLASYSLRDEMNVFRPVNGGPSPYSVAQDTGFTSVPGPLPLSANLSGTGDGGATAAAAMSISSGYGLLSAQSNGSSMNSSASGASSGVTADVGGDPVAWYTDQLSIVSDTLPENTPVIVLITQGLNAFTASAASLVTGASASATVSSSLTISDVGTYNQTMTVAPALAGVSFGDAIEAVPSYVGDRISLTGRLYINGSANTNILSPIASASFEADGTAITAIVVEANLPSESIASASFVPADDPGEVGYIADSGTVYATAVPEPGAALLALAGLPGLIRRRR